MKAKRITALVLAAVISAAALTACSENTADFIYMLTNGLIDIGGSDVQFEKTPDVEMNDETVKKIGEPFDTNWLIEEDSLKMQNIEFTVTDVTVYDQVTDYDPNGVFTVDRYDETNVNIIEVSNADHDEWVFYDSLFTKEEEGMVATFKADGSLKEEFCFILVDMTALGIDDFPENQDKYFLSNIFYVFEPDSDIRRLPCYFWLDESTGAQYRPGKREFFAVPKDKTAEMKLGYIIPRSWLEGDGSYLISTGLNNSAFRYIDLSR